MASLAPQRPSTPAPGKAPRRFVVTATSPAAQRGGDPDPIPVEGLSGPERKVHFQEAPTVIFLEEGARMGSLELSPASSRSNLPTGETLVTPPAPDPGIRDTCEGGLAALAADAWSKQAWGRRWIRLAKPYTYLDLHPKPLQALHANLPLTSRVPTI